MQCLRGAGTVLGRYHIVAAGQVNKAIGYVNLSCMNLAFAAATIDSLSVLWCSACAVLWHAWLEG
jgi:hypothetical protein